jgi:3'-phosphoadenosine 5'-phosphosulfate sulfotransferase (PAPS reductase)/FAD synthetase
MYKYIKAFAILSIVLNSQADTSTEQSACINDALIQILKTDESKRERLVVFSKSNDDLELKKLLQQLTPSSENNTFYLIDLDTLWNWDRKNEMKFIYKILDLMNRNYQLESVSPSLKNKYLLKARHMCEGLSK